MNNSLIRLIGWPATVLHGDPAVFDRWMWLKRHLQPGELRTLDAGSGSGAFTMYAARLGNEAVGISFDKRNNRVARERAELLGLPNVRFIDADLRELANQASELGEFDQIICLETIEHIKDDEKLLADLATLTKPGGQLLLTTPYEHGRRLVGDAVSEVEEGGHVRWGYTFETMRDLLSQAGFEMTSEEFVVGFCTQQVINLQRVLSGFNGRLAWVATFPLRIAQVIDRPLTRLIRYPFFAIAVTAKRL